MSHNGSKDPWRIESDSDDEKNNNNRLQVKITTRPATPKVAPRTIRTRTPEWDVPANVPKLSNARFVPERPPSSNNEERSDLAGQIASKKTRTRKPAAPSADEESPPAPEKVAAVAAAPEPPKFDPIALLQQDLKAFIYTHIPREYSSFLQCTLRRDKDGVQGGFFPTFYLQAERPGDGKKFFLLAARKLAKVKRQSEYVIATSVATLSDKAEGEDYVGKLRGVNVAGTEYTLFDNGSSPNKVPNSKHLPNRQGLRRELACIVYNTNILGFKGPRQMSTVIPKLGQDIRPVKDELGILDQWRDRRFSQLLHLRNKTPTYNEDTRTYVLRFTGNRVAQPSVKNFQIVLDDSNNEEDVVMQFGRVDTDTFTCDFRYPLSPIQAFGIALSSFESRLARE